MLTAGVNLLGYPVAHNPNIFPDPEAFKPERFADADSEGNRNKRLLLEFGFGTRECMGKRTFSVMEAVHIPVRIACLKVGRKPLLPQRYPRRLLFSAEAALNQLCATDPTRFRALLRCPSSCSLLNVLRSKFRTVLYSVPENDQRPWSHTCEVFKIPPRVLLSQQAANGPRSTSDSACFTVNSMYRRCTIATSY